MQVPRTKAIRTPERIGGLTMHSGQPRSTTRSGHHAAASPIRSAEEEAAALSLLAARVAFVAERVASGGSLSKEDTRVLSTMADRLMEEAGAIRDTEKPRRRTLEPSSAVAAGFTVDVWVRDRGGREPTDEEMASILTAIAEQLTQLPDIPEKKAGRLASFFRDISSLARTHSGFSGEKIIGREAEFA